MKATEGYGYTDPKFNDFIKQVKGIRGVSRSSGNQSTSLGVFSSSLIPVGATSLGAYYTNGSARIAVTSGGSMSLRWASSAGSNQLFIGGGSWILDD